MSDVYKIHCPTFNILAGAWLNKNLGSSALSEQEVTWQRLRQGAAPLGRKHTQTQAVWTPPATRTVLTVQTETWRTRPTREVAVFYLKIPTRNIRRCPLHGGTEDWGEGPDFRTSHWSEACDATRPLVDTPVTQAPKTGCGFFFLRKNRNSTLNWCKHLSVICVRRVEPDGAFFTAPAGLNSTEECVRSTSLFTLELSYTVYATFFNYSIRV